jgi:membrane protein
MRGEVMIKKGLIFTTKLLNKTMVDNIFALSAQLSYYIILSIIPFLIMAISLLCDYSEYIYNILNSLSNVLPDEVHSIIYNALKYSVSSCSTPYLTTSMLIILWSATSGSAAMINGINIAYGFNTKKNFLFLRLRGILFTLALMISMQIVFAVIVAGSSLLLFVKKVSIFQDYNFLLIDILRFALAFFAIFIILLAAYKFLPYEKVKFSYAYPGAIFAAVSSLAGSYLYSRYVSAKVVYINSIYGNLSGLFVFIIWIYILSIIFLMGAEVNYFAAKQRNGINGKD